MKKAIVLPVAILLGAAALSGCTRTSYAIHTTDGRTIIADGKPEQTDAGLLGYKDANGVKQQINQSEVQKVSEVPH